MGYAPDFKQSDADLDEVPTDQPLIDLEDTARPLRETEAIEPAGRWPEATASTHDTTFSAEPTPAPAEEILMNLDVNLSVEDSFGEHLLNTARIRLEKPIVQRLLRVHGKANRSELVAIVRDAVAQELEEVAAEHMAQAIVHKHLQIGPVVNLA